MPRSTEVLVNTLSLLAPYPPQEKQALLEAPDLKTRADVLVALTEMALSRMGARRQDAAAVDAGRPGRTDPRLLRASGLPADQDAAVTMTPNARS